MNHNKIIARIQRATTGEWEVSSINENLRTNTGINHQAQIMGNRFNGSGVGSSPIQLAITEDTVAPAASQDSIPAELTADGLSRQTGTFSHTADASSYTLNASWNYTGGSTVTVAKAAQNSTLTSFEASISLDTHFVITLLSPVAVLDSGDTLTIDWGIFY